MHFDQVKQHRNKIEFFLKITFFMNITKCALLGADMKCHSLRGFGKRRMKCSWKWLGKPFHFTGLLSVFNP